MCAKYTIQIDYIGVYCCYSKATYAALFLHSQMNFLTKLLSRTGLWSVRDNNFLKKLMRLV